MSLYSPSLSGIVTHNQNSEGDMFYRISGEITRRVQTVNMGLTDQKGRKVGVHIYNRKCHVEVLPSTSKGPSHTEVDANGIYYFVRVQLTRNDIDFGVKSKYKIFKSYGDMFEFANNCVKHHKLKQSENFVCAISGGSV